MGRRLCPPWDSPLSVDKKIYVSTSDVFGHGTVENVYGLSDGRTSTNDAL